MQATDRDTGSPIAGLQGWAFTGANADSLIVFMDPAGRYFGQSALVNSAITTSQSIGMTFGSPLTNPDSTSNSTVNNADVWSASAPSGSSGSPTPEQLSLNVQAYEQIATVLSSQPAGAQAAKSKATPRTAGSGTSQSSESSVPLLQLTSEMANLVTSQSNDNNVEYHLDALNANGSMLAIAGIDAYGTASQIVADINGVVGADLAGIYGCEGYEKNQLFDVQLVASPPSNLPPQIPSFDIFTISVQPMESPAAQPSACPLFDLTVDVTNAKTGKPVSATIDVAGATTSTTVNSSSYTIDNLLIGGYVVCAYATGYYHSCVGIENELPDGKINETIKLVPFPQFPVTIKVTPANPPPFWAPCGSVQLEATALNAEGQPVSPQPSNYFWISTDPVITTSITGDNTTTVSALAGGVSEITAWTDPGVLSNPVTVTATQGTLEISPASLQFWMPPGGSAPKGQTLMFTTPGCPIQWTADGTVPWLDVSSAGSTPAALTATANGNGLEAGTYSGSIQITWSFPGVSLIPSQSSSVDVTLIVGTTPPVESVSLNPPGVLGGTPSTGTVTLEGPAPTGGAVVTLSSSNTGAATVPASVTVLGGQTSATFSVGTSSVASNTSVTISGSCGGVRQPATLTVLALSLSSLSLNPSTVTGGMQSNGTVTLWGGPLG